MKSFSIIKNLECFFQCSKSDLCSLAITDRLICYVYNQIKLNHSNIVYSDTSNIFVKSQQNPLNQYLVHYWPFNGNYFDIITNTSLFNGLNNFLVNDKLGRPFSSLYLNYGYIQAPNGTYIYSEFTIATWVKMYTLENARRFFTIPTSSGNKIFFSLSLNGYGPYFYYKNGNQAVSSQLTIGKWQHLAFVIKGSQLSIYVDGILRYNAATTPIPVEFHSNVYIGYNINNFPNAELDDIKIFNKSLSQSEIVQISNELF